MDMLVTTDWLENELGSTSLVILDASLHLPDAGRNPADEFAAAHIPGARFLALAGLHDPASHMPGKVPDASRVETRLTELGVSAASRIVLYDDSTLRSACRAWFLLRLFGLEDVAVLDGGLGKWRAENRPIETDVPAQASGSGITLVADRKVLRDKAQMLANVETGEEQVIDARDQARFCGTSEDHVHGLAGGHIPAARNLPFSSMLQPDGTFHDTATLRRLFEQCGADLDRTIVTSCGSGVTASVLAFALHLTGFENVALYDGSWAEWGGDPDTPKEVGAVR
ncbi:sulfurtransferase [Parerythrobacter jejuensis]|uniref:Sulfurtransferase n=1 Tax=Parerythrobacter jejuensis TaxID=795812 RepID=A0A845AY24_9SPHN|nr:sulfurtransferase [Parerythrobacter jejuensis]MXP31668.1 sulfurtransferase [Parerythrobacter jejuensis]